MKSVVYVQSGGPTSVINSSLYGAFKEWESQKDQYGLFLGSLHGVEGLIDDDLIDLGQEDRTQIELLKQTPGAILGSSRKKMPMDVADPVYEKIIETVKRHDIGYILFNGGNDSMDTCAKLSKLFAAREMDVKVVGVPKTIDNDLCITDHSIGFGSAAKYVCNAVSAICVDAVCYSKNKVTIIEIMGRDAGWLTASVDLLPEGCRPDLIFIPERKFDLLACLGEIKKIYEAKKAVLIAFSEGIVLGDDVKIESSDGFGHIQLGDVGNKFATIINETLGLKTRCVALNLPQRAFPALISKTDRDEAIECGRFALASAKSGASGQMVVLTRVSSNPYQVKCELYDVSKIANLEKKIPESMFGDDTHMDASFRDYCAPLIQGEIEPVFEQGIVKSAIFKRTKVR